MHNKPSCFEGTNTIILDLETANPVNEVEDGWRNKAGLGLSVGAYYDYLTGRCHWFDTSSLRAFMSALVKRQPFMVSFNGIKFDFALMRAVLRKTRNGQQDVEAVCQDFKALASRSYDILQEIWAATEKAPKVPPGTHSLDGILRANEFVTKTGSGAEAPLWWRSGMYARTLNYCQHDVYATKEVFEHLEQECGMLRRLHRPAIRLRHPHVWCEESGPAVEIHEAADHRQPRQGEEHGG